MMRSLVLLTMVLSGSGRLLGAQEPTQVDPVRAERLRLQIEQRFGERLREELGLSDDQSAKLRVALAGIAARRRGMEQEERRLRQALASQLRPGVAADADSVARLVESLTNHRVAFAQTFKDEMRELSAILNPVQRGQYLMLRDRLMQRAQELLQGRALNQVGGRRPPPP
jgi:hypothetical protein